MHEFVEEISIGESYRIGSTLQRGGISARRASSAAVHLDEAAAAKSHFGKLVASGWHTLAIWMRLNVRELQRQDRERAATGAPLAKQGPSPGFDELKWLKPVYAGDTVTYAVEISAKKESRSRPEWGLVSFTNTGVNQRGEAVVSFIGHVFLERREAATPETSGTS